MMTTICTPATDWLTILKPLHRCCNHIFSIFNTLFSTFSLSYFPCSEPCSTQGGSKPCSIYRYRISIGAILTFLKNIDIVICENLDMYIYFWFCSTVHSAQINKENTKDPCVTSSSEIHGLHLASI